MRSDDSLKDLGMMLGSSSSSELSNLGGGSSDVDMYSSAEKYSLKGQNPLRTLKPKMEMHASPNSNVADLPSASTPNGSLSDFTLKNKLFKSADTEKEPRSMDVKNKGCLLSDQMLRMLQAARI